MPVRALGAPHTTCTGSPAPVSTMQTRSRSALGCGAAEITRATVKGASSLALSSSASTSSPIIVSLSAIAAADASVSRCSLSQERVNFIVRHPSRTQAAGQRRQVERAEAVMREPAHVGLKEGAQVRHAILEHGDAVDPHTPGEALILVRIDADVAQHVRMHHSTAEDLHPVLAFAETHLVLAPTALDVGLERGLGEREERRPEAHLDALDLEERFAEFFEDPLQVAEMRALVDDKALDLMEHRRVGLVGVDAIGATRDDDADRRLLAHHGADLHRRRVSAQQQPRAVRLRVEEERVVHLAGRMALRDVELGEVEVVGLDIGSFRDRKAHVGEDRGQLVDHPADRMDATQLGGRFAYRQRNVDRFGIETLIERLIAERLLAVDERGGHSVLESVNQGPLRLALLRRHRAERAQQRGYRSVLPEGRDANDLDRGLVGSARNFAKELLFKLLDVGHGLAPVTVMPGEAWR